MFVVLQIENRKTGLVARARERFSPDEPRLSKIAVKGGAPFFVLSVRRRRDGVPWEELQAAAGRGASRILFTTDDRPPERSRLRAFEPRRLPFRAMWNSVADVLQKSGVKPSALSIGICDPEGGLCGELTRAVHLAAVVRVATRKTRLYETAAEKMMSRYGASVLVDKEEGFLDGCNVVVKRQEDAAPCCAVISANGFPLPSPRPSTHPSLLTGEHIALPDDYASLLPANVDETLFACALYECCSVRAMEKLRYKRLFLDGKEGSSWNISEKMIEILQN